MAKAGRRRNTMTVHTPPLGEVRRWAMEVAGSMAAEGSREAAEGNMEEAGSRGATGSMEAAGSDERTDFHLFVNLVIPSSRGSISPLLSMTLGIPSSMALVHLFVRAVF